MFCVECGHCGTAIDLETTMIIADEDVKRFEAYIFGKSNSIDENSYILDSRSPDIIIPKKTISGDEKAQTDKNISSIQQYLANDRARTFICPSCSGVNNYKNTIFIKTIFNDYPVIKQCSENEFGHTIGLQISKECAFCNSINFKDPYNIILKPNYEVIEISRNRKYQWFKNFHLVIPRCKKCYEKHREAIDSVGYIGCAAFTVMGISGILTLIAPLDERTRIVFFVFMIVGLLTIWIWDSWGLEKVVKKGKKNSIICEAFKNCNIKLDRDSLGCDLWISTNVK